MWKKFRAGLDKSLEFLTAFVMGVLVLDVTWQVMTRFILKNPSSWTEELATYLMIWVGLLGSAVALNRGAHLGIDFFVGKLIEKKRLFTELFVYLCVSAFSITVMFYGGLKLVSITLMQNQLSPALGLKMGYVYIAVPLTGFFLTIYGVEFFINTLTKLKNLNEG